MLGIGRCLTAAGEPGTAVVVGDDLALTGGVPLRRVPVGQGADVPQCDARFRLNLTTVDVRAEVSDADGDAPIALLRLTDRLPVEIEPVAISCEADRGERFWAMGYPAAVKDDFGGVSLEQVSVHGEINDFITSLEDGTPVLTMFPSKGRRPSFHGLSGAPVLVGTPSATRMVGLVRYNPPASRDPELAAGGLVVATPIEAIASRWPELRERLVAPSREMHRRRLAALVEIGLEKDGRLPAVESVDPYRLRVSDSPYGTVGNRHPYVPRDRDGDLDRALVEDLFVLVVGPSKAGKSRTAFEAACRVLPGAAMFVPDPGKRAVQVLDEDLENIGLDDRPLLIWLDDLDRYLTTDGGLTRDSSPASRNDGRLPGSPGLTVLATLTTTKREQLRREAGGELDRAADQLIDSAKELHLDNELSDQERIDAQARYPTENFEGRVGIGERLGSPPPGCEGSTSTQATRQGGPLSKPPSTGDASDCSARSRNRTCANSP